MWIYGFFFLLQAHGESYITAGVRTSTIMALRPLRAAVVVVVVVVVEGANEADNTFGSVGKGNRDRCLNDLILDIHIVNFKGFV